MHIIAIKVLLALKFIVLEVMCINHLALNFPGNGDLLV